MHSADPMKQSGRREAQLKGVALGLKCWLDLLNLILILGPHSQTPARDRH